MVAKKGLTAPHADRLFWALVSLDASNATLNVTSIVSNYAGGNLPYPENIEATWPLLKAPVTVFIISVQGAWIGTDVLQGTIRRLHLLIANILMANNLPLVLFVLSATTLWE